MKVLVSLTTQPVTFASVGLPDDTKAGKIRIEVLSADRSTVVASQDVDGTEATFSGIAAGSYIGRAQPLTDAGDNLGSPFEQNFSVDDQGGGTPPAQATFDAPVGLSVTVSPDDTAA